MIQIVSILIAVFLTQQTPQSTSIEGTVLRGGTTQPIGNAIVELRGSDKSAPAATSTAADGKFEFRNLAQGQYRLTVSRSGYLDSAYRQRGPNGNGSTLSVIAGQTVKDVRITMIPTGAISGRVHDSNGEPLANVDVQAMKYSYLDGERRLSLVKAVSTNDRGEYRLFWLAPGTYYLTAQPSAQSNPGAAFFVVSDGANHRTVHVSPNGTLIGGNGSGVEKLGQADAPLFYPGASDSRSAAPIDLRPGLDISGIDFSVERVKTHTLRGTVINGLTGTAVNAAGVTLVSREGSILPAQRGAPTSDGGFEIKNVLPASYYLVATNRTNIAPTAQKITGGRIPVEVEDTDIDQLTLMMSPAVDLEGELTFEGAVNLGGDHPVVTLRNKYQLPGMAGIAQIYGNFKNDRQFTLNDVIEGDYRIQMEYVPKGTYVKSIRFGGTDALNGIVSIDSRSTDRVQVVISSNGGKLDGTVLSRNREPLPNTPVALVPDAAHRDRNDLYRNATTDDYGKFHIEAIAPGEYSLFAWEDTEQDSWRDPEFVRRNEALGKLVHVVETGSENIEIIAIPFEF